MPMYQYVCRTCAQTFEKQLRMAQAGETQTCPQCGSQETRKRISAVAVNGVSQASAPATITPARSPFT